MDLKDFTKQTLIQIVEGTKEANEVIANSGAKIPTHNIANKKNFVYDGPNLHNVIDVEFDVAITTLESEGANGGGSLKVASLINIGGAVDNKIENQTISRIKYSLPLMLPKN